MSELKENIKKIKEESEKLKKDFSSVFRSEEGKKALILLKNLSGYQMTSLARDKETGEILANNTIAAEGARHVWLTFRNYIDESILKEVETRSK